MTNQLERDPRGTDRPMIPTSARVDSGDVLDDVLDALHVTGALYFRAEFSAPFGVGVPAYSGAARFHVCLQGRCSIAVDGVERPQRMEEGDLIVVPHGRAHILGDRPGGACVPLDDALRDAGYDDGGLLAYGGGGDRVVLVCGHFAFEQRILHPLLDALPPLLHFAADETRDYRWLDHAMRFVDDEARADRPGGAAVVSRLAELLFIQVLRAWIERDGERIGPISAIRDPRLGRALRGLHERPARAWTVAMLARLAGMSRTSFAALFHERVGVAPMQYLARWRIEKAKVALRSASGGVAEIAEAVGYQSESAFCRAFKRHVGVAPGAYRAGTG